MELDNSGTRAGGQPASLDEKSWKLITWGLGIIGVILLYAAGPRENPRVIHWARLSIALFIASIAGWILSIALAPIPVLGTLASLALWLGLLAVWVIGLFKALNNEEWNPPILSSIAGYINMP